MKKYKSKPYCDLGITNPISITRLVDKKIEPIIKETEKQLREIAKKENLLITGIIWVYNLK